MSNKTKKKQVHLSKELLLMQAEQKKQEKIRRDFIDQKFFPAMESVTSNLEDATRMCETLKVAIHQAFINYSKKMLLKDLELVSQLNKKDDVMTKKYTKVLEVLADQSVDDALRMCEGLFDEANRVLIDKMQTQKLGDFKNKKDSKKKK